MITEIDTLKVLKEKHQDTKWNPISVGSFIQNASYFKENTLGLVKIK